MVDGVLGNYTASVGMGSGSLALAMGEKGWEGWIKRGSKTTGPVFLRAIYFRACISWRCVPCKGSRELIYKKVGLITLIVSLLDTPSCTFNHHFHMTLPSMQWVFSYHSCFSKIRIPKSVTF